jgi:hypothetical protein
MHRWPLFFVSAALVASACTNVSQDHAEDAEQDLNALDRHILGVAPEYAAKADLKARTAALAQSHYERRRVGWSVAARALRPLSVPSLQQSIPLFLSWYSSEETVVLFDKGWSNFSLSEQKNKSLFSSQTIQELFLWNPQRAKDLPSWSEERYQKRLAELSTPQRITSLGQNTRVLLSPALVGSTLANYSSLASCGQPDTTASHASQNTTPCFREAAPIEAVAAKASWMPTGEAMAVYDTSAETLARTLARGTWGEGDRKKDPEDKEIFTMHLSATEGQRLTALHLVTKELEHWIWVTLWWSDDPKTDFGADRTEDFQALGEPWQHYKMCVVTDYQEQDPDARGGSKEESLARALSVVKSTSNGTSWCSNPYWLPSACRHRTSQ